MHARLPPPVSVALRCERGTTLIELLIVGGLLSVVVAAAAIFLPTALRLSAADAARVDALDRAGQTMSRVKADVRQAREVRLTAPGVLELALLGRVPGANATVRAVRWDCTLPDGPGLRACRRDDLTGGAPSWRAGGLLDDGAAVFEVRSPAGLPATVVVHLAMRTSGSRGPVVLRSTATQRACASGDRGRTCP